MLLSLNLSALCLREVARALILRGEHLSAIMGPPLRLLPAGAHDVSGGYDPETWRYQLTLDGPSGPADDVVAGGRRGSSPLVDGRCAAVARRVAT